MSDRMEKYFIQRKKSTFPRFLSRSPDPKFVRANEASFTLWVRDVERRIEALEKIGRRRKK